MRRVLIVTYDFPPAGGSGVQRVAKFAKYLLRYGWYPIVLTTRYGRSGPRDSTMLAEIEQVEVHRTTAPDPHRLLAGIKRLFRRGTEHQPARLHGSHLGPWHPAALLIPDGKLAWIPFGVSWALRQDKESRAHIVLSTVPTPTAAILGSIIARLWGVPHVLDYRDPWTGAYYMPKRFRPLLRIEAALERRILEAASVALVVPGAGDTLPKTGTTVEVIHNGFDEEDFRHARPRRLRDGFTIAHVGILWEGRDLGPLLLALRILREREPDLADNIHFLQVGRVDQNVADQLKALGRVVGVSALPSVSHSEAIAYMLGSDLLYLPTSHDHLPGKTYEYIRSGVPVLGLGSKDSHLQRLLAETGGGEVIAHSDVTAIAHEICQVMKNALGYPSANRSVIGRYSRESQTSDLARLLDDTVLRGSG